jgi:(p)ppGpp synthase/HD superfamily hydrolase
MMTKEEFLGYRDKYQAKIEKIRQRAHELHENVNQIYGDDLPYGFHLDMVAEGVEEFGHLVCVREEDVLPIFFGAFFHDTIEDARQTYNDVMKEARKWLSEEQALMATEIVYALTNDKGRTRAERAGEKYYKGIRATPYATFVKLCDRLANVTYTCSVDSGKSGFRMREVYKSEMPHFLPALKAEDDDPRKQLPFEVIMAMAEVLIDEVDRDEVRRQWGEY